VSPPVSPMLAKLVRALPRGDLVYEPKWDGFRALAFVDAAGVDLRSRNDRRLARYFPEVAEALQALGPGLVLDGEIVVAGEHGLDFAALMARLHPAATRVERLRAETPAAFVAFDLLAHGSDDLRARPFAERRARLEEVFAGRAPGTLVLTPATRDPAVAERWLAAFRARGIDGVMAKEPSAPYAPGRRAGMAKVKHERTAEVVVAGARFEMPGPVIASLLLGVHDERGQLVHVGVVSQLTRDRRAALARELAPLAVHLEGHPWEHGFGLDASPLGRLAGSAGRWVPGTMVRDWIPLAPTRVCEVAYDMLDGRRLRYPARFVRWRPDREAASCGVGQLDVEAGPESDVGAFLWP
jgi:ATP-dependent DNA ligase